MAEFDRLLAEIREGGRHEEIAFLDALLSITSGVIVDLESGEILYATTTTERLFGYAVRGELVGHVVEELLPERYREQHALHRQAFLENPLARRMGEGRALFGLHRTDGEFPVEIALSDAFMFRGHKCAAAIIEDRRGR